jgi:hydroxypyruvate isomerase
MKINLNVETVFTDKPVHERIQLVADIGFKSIEFWMADAKKVTALAGVKQKAGVEYVSFVANAPDGSVGGSPVKTEDREKYLSAVQATIQLVKPLGCKQLITCSGNLIEGRSQGQQRISLIEALGAAGKIAEQNGVTLVLEPLNTRKDHAGYFLDSIDEAATVVRMVNSPAIKLLMDIYHTQIMHGDICARIREYSGVIGHFHAAGVPGRHELFIGELNYPAILETIAATGYQGYFGLEYMPKLASKESLEKTWAMLKPFIN